LFSTFFRHDLGTNDNSCYDQQLHAYASIWRNTCHYLSLRTREPESPWQDIYLITRASGARYSVLYTSYLPVHIHVVSECQLTLTCSAFLFNWLSIYVILILLKTNMQITCWLLNALDKKTASCFSFMWL